MNIRDEDWPSLDIFQRTVAVIAYETANRIASFQNSLLRRLIQAPRVAEGDTPDTFTRELIFPPKHLFPQQGEYMDNIFFQFMRHGESSEKAMLICTYLKADDEAASLANPTKIFCAFLTSDMAENSPSYKGLYIPASRINSKQVTDDGHEYEIDLEDWVSTCMFEAAARPSNMPRPAILDKLAVGSKR